MALTTAEMPPGVVEEQVEDVECAPADSFALDDEPCSVKKFPELVPAIVAVAEVERWIEVRRQPMPVRRGQGQYARRPEHAPDFA